MFIWKAQVQQLLAMFFPLIFSLCYFPLMDLQTFKNMCISVTHNTPKPSVLVTLWQICCAKQHKEKLFQMNKCRTNYKRLNANFMNKFFYEVQIYIYKQIFFKHLSSLEIYWDGRKSYNKVNLYGSNKGNIFTFLALQFSDNHCVFSTNSYFDKAHHIYYSGITTYWRCCIFRQ